MSAFSKEIFRSIRHSLGRFIAIAGIVALGSGFYAGLMMSGDDMRRSLDTYYDETAMMDLRVVSTMGLSESDIEALGAIEGVEDVQAGYETDVLCLLNDEQYVIRMHSLEASDMTGTTTGPDGGALSSNGVNQVELVEGEWPTKPGEAVICQERVMASPVAVGDTIQVAECSSDLETTLTTTEYTITGFVHTSYYTCTTSMGSSTLGNGDVYQFAYVLPENFHEDYPITEAFIKVKGADELAYPSDEYDEAVGAVEDRITAIAAEREGLRYQEIREEAQAELDDARAEYESEKADAQKKLSDAKTKLDDAAATIAESQQKIDDGWAEYEAGVVELSDQEALVEQQLGAAEEQLSAAEAQLDASKTQLDAAKRQLAAGWAQWQAGSDEYEAGLAEWKSNSKQVNEGLAQIEGGLAQLDAGIAQVKAGQALLRGQRDGLQAQRDAVQAQYDALDPTDPETAETRAALEAQLAAMDGQLAAMDEQLGSLAIQLSTLTAQREDLVEQQANLQEARARLDAAKEQLNAAGKQVKAGKKTLQESQTQYEEGLAAYESGAAQVASGWQELAEGRATAQQKISEAKAQLAQGKQELEDGEVELAKGKKEYKSGLKKYKKKAAEADESFADAEAELADAQADIDAIEQPEWLVLDRSKNYGAVAYTSDAERIDNIAMVFPLFFFLIAALVALTTMTRMVEEERVLIGTFKALGYHSSRIISKYLTYAALAGCLGSAIGITALTRFLPWVIMTAYGIMYFQPELLLPLDPLIVLLSVGLGVGVALVVTASAAWKTLREVPASLMLPRAPKMGKRILLERITPLWSRLSFSWKVTFRNIFRYKKRFFMTVVGIAGCSALLLTGLGLRDGINDIIDIQYGELLHYEQVLSIDEDGLAEDAGSQLEEIMAGSSVNSFVWVDEEAMLISGTDGDSVDDAPSRGEELQTAVVGITDPEAFSALKTLRDRVTHDPVSFGPNDVLISEKLSISLGVGEGDIIVLAEQDSLGNAKQETHAFKVTGVTENYIGTHVYLGENAFQKGFGRPVEPTVAYVQLAESGVDRNALRDELRAIDGVKTVSYNDETVESYRTMLKTIDSIMIILVVSAMALAFIVLYNLTNINISERIRELATLKVLGFTPREMRLYIYREVMLLSVAGGLFGSFFGRYMEVFVIKTAEVDGMMFGRSIHMPSYIAAFALIMLFAVLVMMFMRHKLSNINMVESLKSNE